MRTRLLKPGTTPAGPVHRGWVVMILENHSYPTDVRVRDVAETLVGAGYRVTVLAPRTDRGQSRAEIVGGVEVVRFWLPPTAQTARGFIIEYAVAHLQLARLTLVRLIAGADVLHINNPPDTLAFLLVLAKLLRRRTVFDNHDLFPDLFAFRYGSPRLARLLRVFQRMAFREADLVLTTNESQREVVLETVDRDPESVVVVRNGPHSRAVRSASDPAALEDLEAGAPVEVLFLGGMEPQDGVITLAEVLRLLVERHGLDARLTLVGRGSCRAPLEMECSQLGLADRVVCTGMVKHAEVPALLARAHVCVDPAPCNELNHRSTMIKIAEYMAAGKPIVAFDLRETRRTAGDAALYARCGDVDGFAALIAEVAASRELRGELARQAELRLPRLLWPHSAEALVAGYRRLLSAQAQ